MSRPFIVGTAGHIDHGKSSLIQALSGVNPDRLPEEKRRGMTIELGFAQLSLEDAGEAFHLGLIDVPGHSDFVKNMVAGVSALDLALFVVAADDGWMPQTEEHYQILNYLGIRRAVIALTKIDIADDPELAVEDIRENLAGGPWQGIDIIPVSSHTGEGLELLRAAVCEQLRQAPERQDLGKPRLSVDRAFTVKGAGTVVTGTLINGSIEMGQKLTVQPKGLEAQVRKIQAHGSQQEKLGPGNRCALNLNQVSVRDGKLNMRDGVGRGDIITAFKSVDEALVIDVLLQKSARAIRGIKQSVNPLKTGREVMFHHGSSGQAARLHLRGMRRLEPGGEVLAELRFSEPVSVWIGDHFVLRDASLGSTLAGGIVLDADANRRAFRKAFQERLLKARAVAPYDIGVAIRTQLERDLAVHRTNLLQKAPFSAADIDVAIQAGEHAGSFVKIGEWVFWKPWWDEKSQEAGELVCSHHEGHPDELGLPLKKLKEIMAKKLPSEKFFDLLLKGLLASDFVKAGPAIRHSDHEPKLPDALQRAGRKVQQRVESDLINPPNKKDTATNSDEEKALRFLVNSGLVIDLDSKTVISVAGFQVIREQILSYLLEHGEATASELRKETGTSRRILMPLLERLDEYGDTERVGDLRRLA